MLVDAAAAQVMDDCLAPGQVRRGEVRGATLAARQVTAGNRCWRGGGGGKGREGRQDWFRGGM